MSLCILVIHSSGGFRKCGMKTPTSVHLWAKWFTKVDNPILCLHHRYLRVSNLTRATTEGVTKAIEKNPNAELRGVKAHFSLDYSGRLILTSVDCLFHPTAVAEQDSTKDESAFQSE